MAITFFTVLAYVGAGVGTLMAAILIYLNYDYNKPGANGGPGVEKLLDQIQGYTKVYEPGKWMLIALVSWVWLVTTWVS